MNAAQIKLLSELHIIGELRVKEQLYTNGKQICSAMPSWYTWFVRGLWYKESRKGNLAAIDNILQKIYHTIDTELAKNPPDVLFLTELMKGLHNANEGLTRLETTYSDDTVTTTTIKLFKVNNLSKLQLLSSYGFVYHDADDADNRTFNLNTSTSPFLRSTSALSQHTPPPLPRRLNLNGEPDNAQTNQIKNKT